MEPKIHLLDSLTANQIAAGEVIERPVSIVKELLENAIDAGSQRIHVEVLEGGLEWIRVTDQGSGIAKDDLSLAIQRHATSKLRVIYDLDSLATLGFRGEALASIASVSSLQIVSRPEDQTQGYQLSIKGEEENPQITIVGCPVGTSVTVADLFFNTPARLKFLKSKGYESGLIHDLLIEMALGYPDIDFKLDVQGKTILNTAGVNNTTDLTELFYGKEARNALVAIEGQVSHGYLEGFITAPPYSRGTRKGLHVFVNGRRVISKEIQWAITHGLEYLLPKGRFPVAVLRFSIPGQLLDVNVHPGKLEIRINDSRLYPDLTRLVRSAVSGGQMMPDSSSLGQLVAETDDQKDKHQNNYHQVSFYKEKPQWNDTYSEVYSTKSIVENNENIVEEPSLETLSPQITQENTAYSTKEFSFGPHTNFQIIGQLHRTFILAETEAGLMIIDQHVAHERVLYEKFLKENQLSTIPAQMLLTPITIHLSALEEEILIKHIMVLSDLGMILERFGPRCYILRSVPQGQETINAEFFKDFLDKLNTPIADDITQARQALLIMMSCKAAIKANQTLSVKEMEALIKQLQQTEHPMTCPHGRPIIYLMPYQRLLSAFGRSG